MLTAIRYRKLILTGLLTIYITTTFALISMIINMDDQQIIANQNKLSSAQLGKKINNMTIYSSKRRKPLQKSYYPIALSKPYKINNEGICRDLVKLSCIVMVHTSPDHFERRRLMRQTWLNSTFYFPESIRVVFLLGLVSSSSLQGKIENENSIFKDIVQGYFIDSYRNLTNKGVMGLKWITEYCQNAQFTLKIDDDVFINMFNVFNEMTEIRHRQKYIICRRNNNGTNIIHRDKGDKWYVHRDQFKGMKYFPYTACSGLAVFVSRDLVPMLYKSAQMSPFFWVDDLYLFGILPAKIKGVIHHGINQNANMTMNHTKALKCYKEKGYRCPYFVVLTKPEKDNIIMKIWETII